MIIGRVLIGMLELLLSGIIDYLKKYAQYMEPDYNKFSVFGANLASLVNHNKQLSSLSV